MAKRVYLVTGAAGFLGGEVCRQLLAAKQHVRAFVLPNDPSVKFIPENVEIIKGDLCDPEALKEFFAVPDGCESVVLHVASIVAVGTGYSQKVVDVNVGGTQNIIDLCLSHKECKKLVYVGSTGAIPEQPKGTPIREVAEFEPRKIYGLYGQTKAQASQLVLDAVREHGLNACIVQPSGILGPGDAAVGETTSGIIQMLQGGAPVSLNGTFNLCDVRDLAYGVISAVENGKAGESYILANKVVSNREFSETVAKEGKVSSPKLYLPGFIAKLAANVMEKQAKRKGERPFLTKYLVYNLTRNNEYDSSKAKKDLGYSCRPFSETVHDEVAWIRERNLA